MNNKKSAFCVHHWQKITACRIYDGRRVVQTLVACSKCGKRRP